MLDVETPARAIIVEDDVDLRETLRRALAREGFQVCLAGDGQEALSLIAKRPFDVAIIDLVLPGMGGMRVLEEMRRRGLSLPAVIITAYGDRISYNRALELGASDFLAKPLKLVEVYRAVRKAMAGG
jgi:DNA-binding response OmpR family regulator